MTRSNTFRTATFPRLALAIVAMVVAGFSAPPAAAQTAIGLGSGAAVSEQKRNDDEARRRAAERERRQRERAEAQRREQRAAQEAARVEAERVARVQAEEAAQLERFFEAAAAYDAEQKALAERAAAEAAERRAAEERSAAERAEAARVRARQSGSGGDPGLAALRRCESGGDYGAVSSSGTYRGAYQFSQSTWNSVAASTASHLVGVDPASAAPADQDAMARALKARSGSSPWPVCGRHL